jgi:hypothetical protein
LSPSWARSNRSNLSKPISTRSILMLTTLLGLGLPSGLFPFGCLTNYPYVRLFCHIRAFCPAHLNLLDLIILITLGEEYKSCSPSLCSFLHPQSLHYSSVQIFFLSPSSRAPTVYNECSSLWRYTVRLLQELKSGTKVSPPSSGQKNRQARNNDRIN